MKKYFMLMFAISAGFANAYVDCPVAKVEHIQPDKDLIYIRLEQQNWQILGYYSDPATTSKLAVALTAYAMGKPLRIRFEDGHDETCQAFGSKSTVSIRID